ncbi:CHASE2 domain-containing protein [Komagataeibacter rhaeticus]|nr:CHASE2 domain-containing protein [Komagataeibacter rhaeticus]
MLFKLLDPLAMESATKQSSARFLAGLSDAFYGMQDSPARDRISVVEVTDKDLSGEYFATTWPLTYARHAEVIDRMLDAGPAAIMVDIRFNAERAGESLQDTFGPVIARAKRMGVPLFFARGQLGGGYDDLPEPLTQSQIINGWKMPAGFYPLLLAPPRRRRPVMMTVATGKKGRTRPGPCRSVPSRCIGRSVPPAGRNPVRRICPNIHSGSRWWNAGACARPDTRTCMPRPTAACPISMICPYCVYGTPHVSGRVPCLVISARTSARNASTI